MSRIQNDQVRQHVRNRYKEIAIQDIRASSCCSPSSASASCCGSVDEVSAELGYSNEELSAVPQGANLGLGCGNPQTIASLQPGEAVLDLGSGAGLDCFLASNQVGETGRVFGVDMTPEMVSRARGNALRNGYSNVDFRLGEIEHLPIADSSIDVVISNCVINLSPDKQQVFNEAYRVLKTGGRLAISDIVTTAELPAAMIGNMDALASCIAGAATVEETKSMLRASGFSSIVVEPKDASRAFINEWIPGANTADYIQSAVIQATK